MVGLWILLLVEPILCQYVSTLAGSGSALYSDGQGTNAMFNRPFGLAFDSFGNLFVADLNNNRIRKINKTGYVSTVAGSGAASYSDGQGTNAMFNNPLGLAFDSIGNLIVTDYTNNRIRKVNATGYVSTVAGSGAASCSDGQGTNAMFNNPFGAAIDSLGNIIVGDGGNHRIRKINVTGYVTTVAGNGTQAFADGQGNNAMFNWADGVTLDSQGNILVADQYNHRIRKVNASGYVSTLAGNGTQSYADGQATNAMFNRPSSIAIDSFGSLYIGDVNNERIRKVNASGYVSTVAGSGASSYADGPAANAMFNSPFVVIFDSSGNLIVADTDNHRIRKINITLATTTEKLSTSTSTTSSTSTTPTTSSTSTTSTTSTSSTTTTTSTSSTTSTTSTSSTTSTTSTSSTTSTTSTSSTISTTSTSSTTSTTSTSSTTLTMSSTTSSTLSTSTTSTTSSTSTTSTTSSTSTTSTTSSTSTTSTTSSTSTTSTTLSKSTTSIYSSTSTVSITSSSPTASIYSTAFNILGVSTTLTVSAINELTTSKPSSTSTATYISPTTSPSSFKTQSITFYLKPEFYYSAFVGFIGGVLFITVYFNSKRREVAWLRKKRRLMQPPKRVINYT